MSGFQTHMLIGAVGGMACYHLGGDVWLGHIGVPAWANQVWLVAMTSAVLATLPDIDEPGSFIARRVVAVCSAVGLVLGGWLGLLTAATWMVPGAVVGIIGGHLLGKLGVRGVRMAAGGHRRLTHSLVLAAALAAISVTLWRAGTLHAALVPGALAWAIGIHLIGDVVTVAGVPVLYPLSSYRVRVLPTVLARVGEGIIAGVALILGAWLVRHSGF